MSSAPRITDVFIAGGGPAGLAAGIAARLKGMDVVVADGGRPDIDKACGEGLMPGAVEVLAELGVGLGPELGYRIEGIRFIGGGTSVEARFPAGSGLGVRRTALHRALREKAEAVGVRLLWAAQVTRICNGSVCAGGETIRCGFIVGADGEASSIRRWAGLDERTRDERRFGFRRHFAVEPWSGFVEVYWAEGCELYVTPVSCGQVGVAVLTRDPAMRLDAAMAKVPALARRLRGARACSRERGAVTASRRLRRVCTDRIALIGDASGSVDAISGDGLCLAFRQSLALARAMERGDLRSYQVEHERIRRGPACMAALLLMMDRHDGLRRLVFSACSAKPAIFSHMLAVHAGGLSTGLEVLS